jgi:hypothetical protein
MLCWPPRRTSNSSRPKLREAIRNINQGDYEDAVTSARKAIDALAGEWPIRIIDRSVGTHSREVAQAIHSPSFHRPEWPSTC